MCAASFTVRAIGPATSRLSEMGMIPLDDINPTVGFKPTIAARPAGFMMLPSVCQC
jgi:hypothetical protein